LKNLPFLLLLLMPGLFACRQERPPTPLSKEPDYKKAESFLYKQNDSAFYYFNKVATGSKDSLQIAMSYNNMAVIQSDAGDYFGAQESLSRSLTFLDAEKPKDHRCLASDYNELGLTSIDLKNYDAALSFFDLAIKFALDKKVQLSFLNNKALACQKKKAYPEALKIYQSIIAQTTRKETYSRILTNIATTKWLSQPGYNAAPVLIRALSIRQKANDRWGENSSFAHLADYYTLSRPDSALFYARKMYAIARQLSSPDDQLEALQKLIRLAPSQTLKTYFNRYQELSDSLQTARNAAKNQFALIRYNAEKNKADNLKLQKDNTEKRYEIARQRLLLAGTLLLIVIGSISAAAWYRKRKRRLEQEADNAIREHELKTSRKVHDVVANGLYRMMTEVENQDGIDKENLLQRIDDLYEKSRDISYEETHYPGQDFRGEIAALVQSFAIADTKVVLAGNTAALWEKVAEPVKQELRHILQELMVNMKKHSRAGNAGVKFEQEDNRITITYTDDGIGILATTKYKNGLINTGNRIKAIQGTISFAANGAKGLRILISFPMLKDLYV
jgi:tetratricopeptide (TPR) repeat protein